MAIEYPKCSDCDGTGTVKIRDTNRRVMCERCEGKGYIRFPFIQKRWRKDRMVMQ